MALRDDGLRLSSFECKIALLLFKNSRILKLKSTPLLRFSLKKSFSFSLSDFWKKELDFRKKGKKIREKKGGRFLSEKQEEKKERVDLSFGSLIS